MLAALRPLAGHAVFLLLVQVALLLLAARLGAEVAKRLSLPAVVGELAAGIVLGPSGLGHFAPGLFALVFPPDEAQFHLLEAVGTLGMVLLLLIAGLETDVRLLRNLGRAALIASGMGMVVPFATGFGLGVLMPEAYLAQPERRLLFSFFLATAMAISAMPVIAKILIDLKLTRRNIGVVILSAGVVDDTVGWLVLSMIAGAATQGSVRIGSLLLTLLMTFGFIAFTALALFPAARKLFSLVRRFRAEDSDLVFVLVITLLCGAVTEWIGVHAVFGAFIAGTLLRQIELKEDTVHRLQSFVFAVLAPVFFGIVGLKVNLWILGGGWMLAVVVGIACLGKLLGCTIGSLWGGLRFWEGLSIAVAMNARGAMELVVATIGLSLGILNQQMFSMIVVVAILTTFMAPLGLRLTLKRVRLTEDEEKRILAAQSKGVFDPRRVRVLCPTSGGANAAAVLRLAAALAKQSAHALDVLSVKGPVAIWQRLLRLVAREKPSENGARPSELERLLVGAGLPPTIRERGRGDVGAAILHEANKGVDYLVMGASHGSGGLGGPVLEEVVRRAPCHLVMVKAGAGEQRLGRILVPYDGGVFSRFALEFASRLADGVGAELTLGLTSDHSPEGAPEAKVAETTLADADLDRLSPVLRASVRRPKVLQLGPEPAFWAALAHQVASQNFDLVVVGAENRAVQHRLFFGPENERLIREAPITLALVVPNVALLR